MLTIRQINSHHSSNVKRVVVVNVSVLVCSPKPFPAETSCSITQAFVQSCFVLVCTADEDAMVRAKSGGGGPLEGQVGAPNTREMLLKRNLGVYETHGALLSI